MKQLIFVLIGQTQIGNDIDGKNFNEENLFWKVAKIDVSQLSSGMYFIEVVTNEGKSAKKIIIE